MRRGLALGHVTRRHAIRWVVAGSLVLLGAVAVGAYAEAATPAGTSLSARVGMLEADVQAAEDLQAIKRLQRSYGYCLDKGMWTDLAEYFTQDAVANYPAGVYIGKESIREHLYRNVGNVPMGQVGLGDGQGASGRWRALATFGSLPGGATWAEGIYQVRYRKEDGVWKFSKLATWNTLSAGYEGGWAKNVGRGMPGPSADYPPDAPPTREVAMFPVVFNIIYHYANLVSGRTELPTLSSIGEQLQRFPVPPPVAPPPRAAQPGNGE